MAPESLRELVDRRPFEPFSMVLTTGERYDIRHPELIMIGQGSVIIGLNENLARAVFKRTVKVDLTHIARIERSPDVDSSSNGSAV